MSKNVLIVSCLFSFFCAQAMVASQLQQGADVLAPYHEYIEIMTQERLYDFLKNETLTRPEADIKKFMGEFGKQCEEMVRNPQPRTPGAPAPVNIFEFRLEGLSPVMQLKVLCQVLEATLKIDQAVLSRDRYGAEIGRFFIKSQGRITDLCNSK